MKRNVFSIRLSADLSMEISRQAAQRGITRTAWAAHLIERGLLAETAERFLQALEQHSDAAARPGGGAPMTTSTVPTVAPTPPGWEQVVFMGCFATSILKQLNASLIRSTSEVGKIASAAREQAIAESQAILKRAGS